MRILLLPLICLGLTGAGAGYGDIDAARDTSPMTLARQFCAERMAGHDMSRLAPWFAPKLRHVLQNVAEVPWQSDPARPVRCDPEVMFGQDNIVGVLIELHYQSLDGKAWTDVLNFERTPTSWLLNNVFYGGGGNLRFRLFTASGT